MANYSKQRELILSAVRAAHTHPTAYEIYETVRQKMPNISLGTVYRNLALLSKSGEIDALLIDDGNVRYDGNVKKHLHLTCTVCGRIDDVILENCGRQLEIAAEQIGFKTERGVFVLYGICKNCQSKLKK